ncbi:MAG: AI-2E family transporter [Eggerthellaceae bacterium]|jgi:predicted PurR-regulated permease PerM|nr:AI-2E family transporter [Eggerthellaceae bacterium]
MQLFDDSQQEEIRKYRSQRNCFRVWTIIGSIILICAFAYVMNILSMPLSVIVWTAIIVFCLRTPVKSLEERGVNRLLGTSIAYVGAGSLLVGFSAMLFSPVFGVGDQFRSLAESIPAYFQRLVDWAYEIYATYFGFLQNDFMETWVNEAAVTLTTWASGIAKSSADGLMSLGSSLIGLSVIFALALVIAFWILIDLPALGRECRRLISGKHEQDMEMLHVTITRVMGGFIKATLVQAIISGLGCGIAIAIIGLPNAGALAGIIALLNIIPVLGPWVAAILVGIVGIFVSPLTAFIALAATVAIQLFVAAFVTPKLMADSVDVHPAVVFIALLAGSALGGLMGGFMGGLVGVLVSIPAAAALKAVFVYYFEKKTGRQIVAEDGVFFKGVPACFDDEAINPIADATSPSRSVQPSPMANLNQAAKGLSEIRRGRKAADRLGAAGKPGAAGESGTAGRRKRPAAGTKAADTGASGTKAAGRTGRTGRTDAPHEED